MLDRFSYYSSSICYVQTIRKIHPCYQRHANTMLIERYANTMMEEGRMV